MCCSHRLKTLLSVGLPAPLFWSLDFERIWSCEEKLVVEKTLGDSKHKPSKEKTDTFDEANTRSY